MMELKSKLLFLLGFLFVVMGLQAQDTKTISVTFSDFTPGSQYADNERHDLGNGLVIYTTDCHFTEELRIYSSSTYNGYVVSDPLPGKIIQMSFSMGYKKETLNIYGGLNNDDWELIEGIETLVTSYKDYSLNISADKGYTRFKLDVAGDNQIRIKSMSITYVVEIDKPTLSTSRPFMESMTVEMTNNTDGATIYYTTDGSNPTVDNGKVYTSPFTITETTTVKAIAIKGEYVSEVVEATYTKIIPECVLPIVTPQGGETIESATEILQNSIITITPAEYNTVTYQINSEEATTCTESTTIAAKELGDMVLSISSTCDNKTIETVYYYSVVEPKEVTAMLTSEEIRNANEAKYSNTSIKSNCGLWSGYMQVNTYSAQISNSNDSYILSPEFPGSIKKITFSFTDGNTVGRRLEIKAIDEKRTTLGEVKYDTSENPASLNVESEATAFEIYAKDGAVYINQIEVVYEKPSDHLLEVGSTGWATLYLALDAEIPEGVTCYTISSVTHSAAMLTPITTGILPAHTGVIIQAAANTTYTFKYKNSYAGSDGISNLLKGSIKDKNISGGGYILSAVNGEVALYVARVNDDGVFQNKGNKAYLPGDAVPADALSNGLRMSIGETTECDEIIIEENMGAPTLLFDLNGRRIAEMEKGIHIVNGRKVLTR